MVATDRTTIYEMTVRGTMMRGATFRETREDGREDDGILYTSPTLAVDVVRP